MANWFDVAGYGYQEFSAGGQRTFAIVEGQSGAFPLVLLHSIPGASFIWSTTIQTLGRSSRVIAPDYPGWGRSRNRLTTQKVELTRESLRTWLADVVDAQQCSQFDLAGLGDGAWLAMDYLNEFPQKVRRLGLLNLPLTNTAKQNFRWPWRNAQWTKKRLENWKASSGANLSGVEPMFTELFAGGWHAESAPEFPADAFRTEFTEFRDSLRKFDGEVLLGWGARAAGYDSKRAAEFAQGRRMEIWDGAGEFPMWEQPERYASEIKEFFGS